MAREREQRKEKYRVVPILLLMKCIRILLREMVREIAIQKTPDGESEWTVDDYLCHNKKRIERKLLKIDVNGRYHHILYPTNSKEKTEFGKWNITLYIFILIDIVLVKDKLKSYLRKILDIRKDICRSHGSEVTRHKFKVYTKQLGKARDLLYKRIGDRELKKTIDRRVLTIEKGKIGASEVEMLLERWKDLEGEDSKNNSGKTGIDRYFTLETMLSEVCYDVMQALVRKRVRDLGHRSLDSFLRQYEMRIRRQIHTLDKWGRAEGILLPREGETNIEEWDISLLCWVLLNLCFLGEIKVHDMPLIADAVGTFRTVRNEITHVRNKSLSKDKYNLKMENIQRSIRDCLDVLGDADLSEDINDQIEDIMNGVTDRDETMRRCQMSYQNTCIEHEKEKKYLEDRANMQKQLSEIVSKFKDVSIPECQLELMIEDCGRQCSQMLSRSLVAKINAVISGSESVATSEDDEMTRAVVKLIDAWKSKGWNPVSSTEGSVLLDVKCISFNKLCDLYNTYRNDGSILHVDEIQTAAQHFTGTQVKLHVVMYDREMFKCMENIVCTLLDTISRLTTTKRQSGLGNESRINIWMTPNAQVDNGTIPDVSSLTSVDVVGQLSRLADILRKQYCLPSCSIRVNYQDHCLHPHPPKMQCIENAENETMTWTCYDREQFMFSFHKEKGKKTSDDHTRLVTSPPDEKQMTEMETSNKPSDESDLLTQEQEQSFYKLTPPNKHLLLETATHTNTTTDKRCKVDIGGQGAFQDGSYELHKRDLRNDLVEFYRKFHSTMSLSPLVEEYDIPLTDFYVVPPLRLVGGFGGTRPSVVKSYEDIFGKECQSVGNIYLTSKAGSGKTLFSKRMALTWCQAHEPEELPKMYFSEFPQDIQVMNRFEYLFLICLRDVAADNCDIDQMILVNILRQLSRAQDYSDNLLTHILDTRKCLIILDGLDEWTPSAQDCARSSIPKELYIPRRKLREKCTILTTTRPWRLLISSPIQIDHKIEIAFLEESFSERLTERLTLHLNEKHKTERDAADFQRVVKELPRNCWRRTPLILLHLLCLWYNDQPLAKSMSKTFCGIVEFLFKRAGRNPKYSQLRPYRRTNGQSENTDFSTLSQKTYYGLLVSLGQLAFNQLFNGDQSSCLVFNTKTAETVISSSELSFAFKTGILVQKKTPGRSSISFVHKTLQEYMAAIYISTINMSPLDLISCCYSVDKLLDVSAVFAFLSGLDHQKMNEMYAALGNLISNDECTKQYRRSLAVNILTLRMLRLQTFMVDCLEENMNCGKENISLPLTDVVILSSNADSYFDQYLSNVVYLIGKQSHSIKSVHVEFLLSETENTLREAFLSLQYLQKIEVFTTNNRLFILPSMVLKSVGTMKCLHISAYINEETVNAITKMERLEHFSLKDISLSHQQLNILYEHFSELTSLRSVTFKRCCCTYHGIHCDVIHDLKHKYMPDMCIRR